MLKYLLLILLLTTLNANEIHDTNTLPLRFYEDSILKKNKFFEYKRLRLQVDKEGYDGVSKFVLGSYWLGEYTFRSPMNKKEFIKKVRKEIIHKGGKITFFGDSYIHCKVPIGKNLYWATITYEKRYYVVKLVEQSKKKILALSNEKGSFKYDKRDAQKIAFHNLIPNVLGYTINSEKSVYKHFSKERISNKLVEGEYWFVFFKKQDEGFGLTKEELIVNLKEELERINGKVLKSTSDLVEFQVNKTYGEFRLSSNSFSVRLLDESTFKSVLDVNLNKDNIRLYGLQFTSGKDVLIEGSESTLLKVEELLKDKSDLVVEIQGHTDSKGDAKKNLILSSKRAKAVKDALTKRGIDASRLKTRGFGETIPIADNKTEMGRASNRRVELKKIGGGAFSIDIEFFKALEGYKKVVKIFKHGTISNKKAFKIEGKEVRGQYTLTKEKSEFSTFEILKNYESLIIKLGGKIVSQTSSKLFFSFNKKVAGRLSIYDKYYYLSLIYIKKREK